MAFLPKEPLTLTGGCFCGACRYTVDVPGFDERPILPGAAPTPISATESVETRVPVIDIDHCQSCRRISGAVVQIWLICPVAWVTWQLQPLSSSSSKTMAPQAESHQLSTADAVGPAEAADNKEQGGGGGGGTGYHLRRFQATDRATRTFCGKCGTTLTYYGHRRHGGPSAVIDLTIGSLDQDSLELAKPDRHGWWESGTDWIKTLVSRGDGGFLIKHPEGIVSSVVKEP